MRQKIYILFTPYYLIIKKKKKHRVRVVLCGFEEAVEMLYTCIKEIRSFLGL